jgi:hypothetical protein
MRWRRSHYYLIVAASFWAGAGCHRNLVAPPSRLPDLDVTRLPVVPRASLEPNLEQLPAPLAANPAGDTAPTTYRLIDAGMVQCRAAENAGNAGMLESERPEERPLAHLIRPNRIKRERLRAMVLGYSSQELRNQASGVALEAFFQLAESEARTELVHASIVELAETIERIDDLRRQGIKTPADVDRLNQKMVELKGEQLRLRASIDQLNTHLRHLLRIPGDPVEWLWPSTDYSVEALRIDPDRAVHVGMVYRSELNLIRALLSELDDKTLPEVRALTKSFNPLLGNAESRGPMQLMLAPLCKLCSDRESDEVESRRRQLRNYLADRERAITTDIRLTIRLIELQLHVIDVAKRRVLEAGLLAAETHDKYQKGFATFVESTQANLEWYKARAELANAVMTWHRILVRLKISQGVLPSECGCGIPVGP